jgi:hypothetical protein
VGVESVCVVAELRDRRPQGTGSAQFTSLLKQGGQDKKRSDIYLNESR